MFRRPAVALSRPGSLVRVLQPIQCLVLAGMMAWSIPAAVYAQDVSVRAYLTPSSNVGVGQTFVLNVEMTGTRTMAGEPELPDFGGFAQYLGKNTQSSVQMIDGRTSVSLTVQYRYQALRKGTFDIPAFDVISGGQTMTTEPLQLIVSSASSSSGANAGPQATENGAESQDLFVTAEATKDRIRDGESFVVEYRIWTRVDVGSFTFTRVPEPEGFWVEDITPGGQPQVEELTRNGQTYTTAVIRRIALVPTGPGERRIDPVGLDVQVRVRRNDLFSGFFGLGTEVVPTAVISNPLTFQVEPLPPGRPEPFSGVVGRLAVSAALDRDSVDVNEAVTLRVRVSGDGNIRTVPNPVLDLSADFEVFPPDVSESVQASGPGLSGEKTFEYVLIPRAPGDREIPGVSFGFFDERADEYRTAAAERLALKVTGVTQGGPVQLLRGGVSQLREDIRFIHLGTASLRPRGRVLFKGAAFWMFAFLPLAGIAGAVALRRHHDLLEGDVAYARGRRAGRIAKKRLAHARRLASGRDVRAFYGEIARALRGLVADRLNLAEAGLQTSELIARLGARGVGDTTMDEIKGCLEHCDRQRFAPPEVDSEEKARFLERVGHLMVDLDREIR
ncbi:MAG TPA: hypothetical protein DIU18_04505 [Gemmatimonadetes bacterium]|nr:hypothetical protein [Gemmatimonadota bacterium]